MGLVVRYFLDHLLPLPRLSFPTPVFTAVTVTGRLLEARNRGPYKGGKWRVGTGDPKVVLRKRTF